ncbi:hypothetical protein [Amphritea japonica]|uniref:Uncharacterized protein n=1 Tax=Amphritea japonica ATCC BAA-1530 TaxID=1278309 RepID=A0A7R6PC40_9GAMM|nr:hypothetical protein [Amphritea japonica]BBB26663.1 hypothetical protein AMJAP_2072 [Amphritea japonica ATCC BAA-1530]
MTTLISLNKFQQLRHVDEIVEQAENSWWVYRRSIGFNGGLSSTARVVFFGRSKKQVTEWMAEQ